MMNDETQLREPPTADIGPAPSVVKEVKSRADVQAKLLHHMELGFRHPFTPQQPLPGNRTYLNLIVSSHFRLPHKIADEAVMTSATIADLVQRIGDLLKLPNEQLF